jgi:hypothetical protein
MAAITRPQHQQLVWGTHNVRDMYMDDVSGMPPHLYGADIGYAYPFIAVLKNKMDESKPKPRPDLSQDNVLGVFCGARYLRPGIAALQGVDFRGAQCEDDTGATLASADKRKALLACNVFTDRAPNEDAGFWTSILGVEQDVDDAESVDEETFERQRKQRDIYYEVVRAIVTRDATRIDLLNSVIDRARRDCSGSDGDRKVYSSPFLPGEVEKFRLGKRRREIVESIREIESEASGKVMKLLDEWQSIDHTQSTAVYASWMELRLKLDHKVFTPLDNPLAYIL